jgi:hypothetical protein
MIANSLRRAMVGLALLAMFGVANKANAACCGGGTTAYYPSTYNAYYGGSYAAAYPATTGWYPGYYLNQVRARLWGSPSTYVAAYPTSTYYSAGYAPSYSAGYAPSYSAGYAPAYATSYAAPASGSACQSCTAGYAPSGCSTCGVQQVTMRPVCTTACASPCSSGCSTCSSPVVTQTSHVQPASSTCCANTQAVHVQQESATSTRTPEPAPLQTFDSSTSNNGSSSGGPSLPPNSDAAIQREEQKPPMNGNDLQPIPGDDTNDAAGDSEVEDPYKVKDTDSSTYFEAPKLHDPNDRTALRGASTVRTAVYKQPVSYRNVSTQRITDEQVRQDAIGWTSASK